VAYHELTARDSDMLVQGDTQISSELFIQILTVNAPDIVRAERRLFSSCTHRIAL
jgi:hypothetical protein